MVLLLWCCFAAGYMARVRVRNLLRRAEKDTAGAMGKNMTITRLKSSKGSPSSSTSDTPVPHGSASGSSLESEDQDPAQRGIRRPPPLCLGAVHIKCSESRKGPMSQQTMTCIKCEEGMIAAVSPSLVETHRSASADSGSGHWDIRLFTE